MIDPLVEILKSVDLAIVAAFGIVIVLLVEGLIRVALNHEFLWRWRNPFYQWDTDRVIPLITFVVGAVYGWSIGKPTGAQYRFALLYGAAVLGVSRLLHKTVLNKKQASPASSVTAQNGE